MSTIYKPIRVPDSVDRVSSATWEPVAEQQRAIELFLKHEGLRIDAYAGTGKTTTLSMIAESTSKRGLYLAFNRSISDEARGRFPTRVQCSTGHSVAFRGVRRAFGYPDWKLTDPVTPDLIADAFRMPTSISFACGLILERRSYAAVLLDALRRFLQSSEDTPSQNQVPRYGILEALDDKQFASFTGQAVQHVEAIWNAMRHMSQGPPLGHDGYMKLWALSNPQATVDYVMIDEAQDLNPVLLGVLAGMECPIVYVGDPYQQIYEWRGAINAMEKAPTKYKTLLSQSFRFGPEIAAAATIVLRKLGAHHPLRGSTAIDSQIARVRPQVILTRSNAGLISNVLRCLQQNARCFVLGGTQELVRLLQGVQRMKQGLPARVPELLGFHNWKEVRDLSVKPEGEHLRGLVNLVQEHGEDRMLTGLAKCEQREGESEVVCATAHRAKGREWNYVRLDEDFEAGFLRASRMRTGQTAAYAAEARLVYVALTRARRGVQLPQDIQKRLGIRNTTAEILGT
jgi:superfamily I DNA/RNA helicase